MISREHYAKDMLQLLGEIFSKNLNQQTQSDLLLEDGDKAQEPELKSVSDEDESHGKKQVAVTALPLAELSNQVDRCFFITFMSFSS
jgi:hypothetical protein